MRNATFRHALSACAAVLALTVAALPPGAAAQELKIAVAADITSMDPHFFNLFPNNNMAEHIFDKLVQMDADSKMIPGIATSWKVIDPTTWEFKLRKGVKFHDGSELTAEDVAFSIDRVAQIPNSPARSSRTPRRSSEGNRRSVHHPVQDGYAVSAGRLRHVDDLHRVEEGRHGCDDRGLQHGQGRDRQRPLQIRPVRVRGPRRPRAQRQILGRKVAVGQGHVQDHQERTGARGGALVRRRRRDRAAADRRSRADQGDPKFTVSSKISHRVIYFNFDNLDRASPFITDKAGKPLAKNPLLDVRVRRAISKAINRQAIVDRVMEGQGVPSGQLVSEKLFGNVPGLKADAYDVEGAKKLMAEAGYADGFNITIHGPSGRYVNDEKIVQAVAQMLSRIGITAKVETAPMGPYSGRASKQEFSFHMVGWGASTGEASSPLRSLLATFNRDKGWAPSTGAATATSRSTT
jgi:peptide/nickel transport system substrate-binding protein